jgi:hypothetical protein
MSKRDKGLGRFRDNLRDGYGEPLAGFSVTVETMDGKPALIYDRKGRPMANPLKSRERNGRRRHRGDVEFHTPLGGYLLRGENGRTVLVAVTSDVAPDETKEKRDR